MIAFISDSPLVVPSQPVSANWKQALLLGKAPCEHGFLLTTYLCLCSGMLLLGADKPRHRGRLLAMTLLAVNRVIRPQLRSEEVKVDCNWVTPWQAEGLGVREGEKLLPGLFGHRLTLCAQQLDCLKDLVAGPALLYF